MPSLEALVRWHSAEKGVILPADFIPIAEETGLILPVGTITALARRRNVDVVVDASSGPSVAANLAGVGSPHGDAVAERGEGVDEGHRAIDGVHVEGHDQTVFRIAGHSSPGAVARSSLL